MDTPDVSEVCPRRVRGSEPGADLTIGAQVGLVDDPDRVGVIVDSYLGTWRVFWCWAGIATWHTRGALLAHGNLLARAAAPHERVFAEVALERARQDAKWGEQNHPLEDPEALSLGSTATWARVMRCKDAGLDQGAEELRKFCDRQAERGALTWFHVLIEEVAEAAELGHDPTACRAELVQVAAVTIAMIECIDRNAGVEDAE